MTNFINTDISVLPWPYLFVTILFNETVTVGKQFTNINIHNDV